MSVMVCFTLYSARALESPFQTCTSLETPQLSSLVAVMCFPHSCLLGISLKWNFISSSLSFQQGQSG